MARKESKKKNEQVTSSLSPYKPKKKKDGAKNAIR
jgi:hypothetical protein